MKIWKIYALLGLLGIPLFFTKLSILVGWLVGHLVMVTLVISREKYYNLLFTQDKFSGFKFGAYILYTIGLIALPLGAAILFPVYINAYAVFAAYFTDRTVHFIYNIFVKEETHAS